MSIRRPDPSLVIDRELPHMTGWRICTYDRETNAHVVTEAARLALVRDGRRLGNPQVLTALEYDGARNEWFPVQELRTFCRLLQPGEAPPDVNECTGAPHPVKSRRVVTGDIERFKARL